jgi:hypothetical protein
MSVGLRLATGVNNLDIPDQLDPRSDCAYCAVGRGVIDLRFGPGRFGVAVLVGRGGLVLRQDAPGLGVLQPFPPEARE